MKLFRIIGRIFRSPIAQEIGLSVIGAFAPGFLPLIELSIRAIAVAEVKFPEPKSGAQKAAYASDVLAIFAPQIIASIEKATGKELVNEEKFEAGLSKLNDGLVECMNAFSLLAKGK